MGKNEMKKRKLGNSGLEVAPLAFGGNVFGWTVDEPTSFQLLDAFVSAGFNLIDTADIYSTWVPGNQGGESETIIGRWLKRRGDRDKVLIATKVGIEMGPGSKGLSKPYILRAVEDSLRRLQTDYIDLYQSHQDDKETPLEETLSAFAQLIEQGKVRAIGASNYTADRLAEALKVSEQNGIPRYESLQPLYNLYDRADYEQHLEPLCVEKGMGVINYYSIASGFLSGKYRSEADLGKSVRGEGIKKYLNERGLRILDALDHVAGRYDSNPTQVALAWLIARPSVTAPIASATNLEQLNDLVEATKLQLDQTAIELLNHASTYSEAVGR
jgi:aryl-alcohol dehydrogenase-like predicted oxidoreductase